MFIASQVSLEASLPQITGPTTLTLSLDLKITNDGRLEGLHAADLLHPHQGNRQLWRREVVIGMKRINAYRIMPGDGDQSPHDNKGKVRAAYHKRFKRRSSKNHERHCYRLTRKAASEAQLQDQGLKAALTSAQA